MGDETLKPCPFCGRTPAVADIIGGGSAYWVDCYGCEASGPVVVGGDLSIAADAWNTRQADAATTRAEAAEQRAEAADAEVARLRAVIAEEAAELPVWPEGAYQTPTERDVSGVRARLLAALAAPAGEVSDDEDR